MHKSKVSQLAEFGQSLWLDNINRSMIEDGKLKTMISDGLCGMTSNPTIFDNAMSQGDVYDKSIEYLSKSCQSIFDVYDNLTIKDIQDACDLFFPVYERTKGLDGYVSLEVNPTLAHDMAKTIMEAKRLYQKVQRPNVMIKVPATETGFSAVEELISLGINVNVTLIFSLQQYERTAESYINGMRRLIDSGRNPNAVRSVASVFVSRIDNVVDKTLEDMKEDGNISKNKYIESIEGKAAVCNSLNIYKRYRELFFSKGFEGLKDKGASAQRVLWASTGTKNPSYSDIKYITELMTKDTVNTVPDGTYQAFTDHGEIDEIKTSDIDNAHVILDELKALGIDINDVCMNLLIDGLIAFEKSFKSVISTLETKANVLVKK